jgi:hypothetical protein
MILLRLWLKPAEWMSAATVWARYSLGVAGAIITSWALLSQGKTFAALGMARFGRDLAWAAIAFALYGVVGQVFVSKSVLPPSNFINSDLFVQCLAYRSAFRARMAIGVIAIIRALCV